MKTNLKVAAVQAATSFFDKNETLKKAESYIQEASKNESDFVVFPEAFLGGYPRGLTFGTVTGHRSDEGRELWTEYYHQAITIPGKESDFFCSVSKKHKIHIIIGVVEKEGGTLYCSLLYIHKTGKIAGVHRKIKPTAFERVIWGEGKGDDIIVHEMNDTKIGGLICWENYMPMARMALYDQGIEIYVAPTADNRDNWIASMKHIALEGRCFVVSVNQFFTKSMYPEFIQKQLSDSPEIISRGGSAIISPLGEIIAGPVYDNETVLYAELLEKDLIAGKMDFDVKGHYMRPDLFNFTYKSKKP